MTQVQLNNLNQRPLEKRILGRTGLAVTQLGLGAGGNSRLGLSLGQSEEHAAGVVEAALELGLTLVDTARGYRTEEAVGKALRGTRRENVVVSSKSGYLDEQRELYTAQALEAELEKSLKALGLETIDIYFLHGLRREYYEAATERFVPVLDKARQAGKIRFMGITEAFESDTRHEMLQRAVLDDCWDVMMVGYNLINQSARERVLAETRRKGIATLGMFAVRRGLIDEERLRVLLGRMAAGEYGEVQIDLALAEALDLMGALGLRGIAESLSEAAYRFCAYEPLLDCVLSGTSSAEHLRQNLAAVQRGPLPVEAVRRLERIFGRVDGVSAQIR